MRHNAQVLTRMLEASGIELLKSRVFVDFPATFDASLTNLWVTLPGEGKWDHKVFDLPFDDLLHRLTSQGSSIREPVLISDYQKDLRFNFVVPNCEVRSLEFRKDLEKIKPSLENCQFDTVGVTCSKNMMSQHFFNFILFNLAHVFSKNFSDLLFSVYVHDNDHPQKTVNYALKSKEIFAKAELFLHVFH